MLQLVRRLAPRFPVHVACFERAGPWLPQAVEHAATVDEFPIQGFARATTARQLLSFARWCRRHRITVLQTCDFYANVLGLPGALLARVPVRIGSRRELSPDKTSAQLLLQRQAYRCATRIVANSPAAQQALVREGLAPASIAVIPNGLDATAYSPDPSRPPGRTIVTVANLRAEKGHEVLLRAAASLVARYTDLRLRFAGDGPRRSDLQTLVRELGLEAHVEFLGHREDVPAILAAADIFVLPSRSEAFPNGALEAMSAGLPVVASATGGLLDLIEHQRTGILVPPDDPPALETALLDLLEHPERGAVLGANARAEVAQRYSFDRMADAFESLYRSSLPATGRLAARTETAGI